MELTFRVFDFFLGRAFLWADDKLKKEDELCVWQSIFAGEKFYSRKCALREAMPVPQLIYTTFLKAGFCRGASNGFSHSCDAFIAMIDVGFDALSQKSRGEAAQACFGDEMFFSHARFVDKPRSAHPAQPTQPFIRCTATHLQAIHDIVEGDRVFGAE